MVSKLIAIIRKDVVTTYQDRNAILMMFAAPLALSMIIGLAFGTGGDISIEKVPVAVANQDEGVPSTLALGQTFADAFVPTDNPEREADFASIREFVSGQLITNSDAARTLVEDGELAALISIPANFSASIATQEEPPAIELYTDSGRAIGSSIVVSIAHAIANGMNTVILAQQLGPQAVTTLGTAANQDSAAIQRAAARVQAEAMTTANAQSVTLESIDLQGETRTFDALQYMAPSMAILFMTFAMATSATTILREQMDWTLQRIISTPTPRWVFMGGKLGGIYVTGVIQMVILLVSTSALGAMMGRTSAIWGTNYPALALLILAVVFAGTSLGLLIAAISRTLDQANAYSTVILFFLGMIGGSFFETNALPELLPRFTLNHWGIQGFVDLSYNEAALSDIVPNLLALLVMGVILFAVSLWRFNRRLDV